MPLVTGQDLLNRRRAIASNNTALAASLRFLFSQTWAVICTSAELNHVDSLTLPNHKDTQFISSEHRVGYGGLFIAVIVGQLILQLNIN